MQILVTGATGFVGRNLVPFLFSEGHQIKCLVRRHSHTEFLADSCEEKIIGDILDESSIAYAMRNVDAVVHLAGIRVESGAYTFEGAFYLGTRHIVDTAKKFGVKHLIYFSVYGAHGKSRSKFNHYKWMAEEYIRHSGLTSTILRPTIIYGPHDHFVTRWMRKLKALPAIFILGRGHNLIQPISIGDVVKSVLKILKEPGRFSKTYDIGGPDRLTFEEMIQELSKLMHVRRRLFYCPLPIMRPIAALAELLLPNPPFTPDELCRWMSDRVCDQRVMEKEFGIIPEPFWGGLKRYFTL